MTTETITMADVAASKSYVLTEKQLAQLAVELHGGGWSVQQTMNAMIWQRTVLNSGGEDIAFKVKGRDFTVTTTKDVVAEV